MNTEVDRATTTLFPEEGRQAEDCKFFLGSKRGVTGEQLAGQLNRADAQVRTGAARPSLHLDGDLELKIAA